MSNKGLEFAIKFFKAVTRNSVDGLRLSRDEAFPNAECMYNAFGFLWGWDDISIAAMLGVMELESSLNPAAWGGYSPNPPNGDTHDPSARYGLAQWLPASKLIDWCRSEGFDWETIHGQVNFIKSFDGQWMRVLPVDFGDFQDGNYEPYTIEYAVEIWLYNYERAPIGSFLPERISAAYYWYGMIPYFKRLIWPPAWFYGAIKKKKKVAFYA